MADQGTGQTELVRVLEVCCGSADSAIAAVAAGAGRVELCDNLVEGGTTPSAGSVAHAQEVSGGPVMMMIRPRGGDFLYSNDEMEVMLRDISVAKDLGVMGVVFGILTESGRVDRQRTERLVDAAEPLSVTFHRAFDVSRNLMESLDTLMEIGVDRVLTSAGKASVLEGMPVLGDLLRAAGDDLIVLPGGGIRADNVRHVLDLPGVREVHIGARMTVPSSMTFRAEGIQMGRAYQPDEYVREEADVSVIQDVVAELVRGDVRTVGSEKAPT